MWGIVTFVEKQLCCLGGSWITESTKNGRDYESYVHAYQKTHKDYNEGQWSRFGYT